jgi:hypothetical protein
VYFNRLLFGAVLSVPALAGCRQAPPPPNPGPPPLKISYRESQIPTQGMVAGINNPSTTDAIKVIAVFVRSANDKDERSYRLDKEIKPLDMITVGWIEMDGWKLKTGDKLRIKCDGYDATLDTDVP